MPAYDLYPMCDTPRENTRKYTDSAAAARGVTHRLTMNEEAEFARAVRWALSQDEGDDMARTVLYGVPERQTWRCGYGDWVVTGELDIPRVVVGRVPVLGTLLVADENGAISQAEEDDVAWLFRYPTVTPASALIGRGAEFVQPRVDDDIAWQWCWVDLLGPSLAVSMRDEDTVAVFNGRLYEVDVRYVRVALGGVSAWDTIADAGVAAPAWSMSPGDWYQLQKLVDEADVIDGTDKHCAVEYLTRVVFPAS